MDIQITARHLKLTPAIRAYVDEKVRKVEKYSSAIVRAQAILSVEKRRHCCEILVRVSRQTFRALASGADLYSAVDLASDKIDTQLKKHKERAQDRHKSVEELVPAAAATRVSVIKNVPLRPISKDEAVREMDALGYSFWMYMDQESGKVHVIYRRQDDSYGLLQPVKWNGK